MTYYFVELFIFFRLVIEDVYCLQFIFHYTKGMLYVNINSKKKNNLEIKKLKYTFLPVLDADVEESCLSTIFHFSQFYENSSLKVIKQTFPS